MTTLRKYYANIKVSCNDRAEDRANTSLLILITLFIVVLVSFIAGQSRDRRETMQHSHSRLAP